MTLLTFEVQNDVAGDAMQRCRLNPDAIDCWGRQSFMFYLERFESTVLARA